ncbi:enoyl-CoA hydratase/isomerase family protein [Shouchella shacheensis]|uniref:enoyl-CoA hydratase/isomerase family protein n=1 Tax=Shouchella shacheensis TaxID=1649580 RepID=UPI00074008CC|nr:enoyl-CoA hydratase/isomerase family protein [Shouchella shacheensis]
MTKEVQSTLLDNGLGIITLSREKALNSLSYGMVTRIRDQLKAWKDDESVHVVLLEGAGEKAFCAGGDIKTLTQARDTEGGFEQAKSFFDTEYELDLLVAEFPKPIVAFLDGIVMGGGVGLSYGTSHRIVTERTKWAMPEMNISFFPDVGACYFLNQAPGSTGRYAALTASVFKGEDALFLGAADSYVSSDQLPSLRSELTQISWSEDEDGYKAVAKCIADYTTQPPESVLAREQPLIDEFFSQQTVEAIVHSLEEDQREFSRTTSQLLRTKSPLSLKVTLAHLKQSRNSTLAETLETDKTLAWHFLHCDDFYEGVRSVLIDKKRKPAYQYEKIEDVPDELALSFFRK